MVYKLTGKLRIPQTGSDVWLQKYVRPFRYRDNPRHLVTASELFYAAAQRHTLRTEDRVYSLLGLMDVSLPIMYGERNHDFQRLQRRLITWEWRWAQDYTLLAWTCQDASPPLTALAPSLESFKESKGLKVAPRTSRPRAMLEIDGKGVNLALPFPPSHECDKVNRSYKVVLPLPDLDLYIIRLPCTLEGHVDIRRAIKCSIAPIRRKPDSFTFYRVFALDLGQQHESMFTESMRDYKDLPETFYIGDRGAEGTIPYTEREIRDCAIASGAACRKRKAAEDLARIG